MPRMIPAPGIPNGLVYSPAAASVPLTVVGFSGQSEDLQRWTNSGGTVLARINKDGWLGVGSASTLRTALHVQPDNGSTSYAAFLGNANGFNPPTAVSQGLVIGWNRSGGAGESVLGFCTDVGTDPRLDIVSWKGSTSAYTTVLSVSSTGITMGTPRINNLSTHFLHFTGTSLGNVFLGSAAGNFTLSGTSVVAIGNSAATSLTTANNVIAIGRQSGDVATTASNIILIGSDAGGLITQGGINTAVGHTSLGRVTTGVENVGVGELAGYDLDTSSSFNTFIGSRAGGQAGAASVMTRRTAIGYNSVATADDQVMLGTSIQTVVHPGPSQFDKEVLMTEISDPSAPASNKAYLYCRDNGSGKTQIVAKFPTGAVQVVATEP